MPLGSEDKSVGRQRGRELGVEGHSRSIVRTWYEYGRTEA